MRDRQTEEVGLDRANIVIGEQGLGFVGKGRVEPPALVVDSFVYGPEEVRVGPGADSCSRITSIVSQ